MEEAVDNRYTVVVIPDDEDGGFFAYVPAIPNCFTHGETREHALAMAKDAAAALLASFVDHDEEVPVEAPGATVHAIDVSVPAGAAA
jgi:predicted RNase H-like HicB family nuclease